MKNWKREVYKQQKLIAYVLITLCILFANYKLFFKPTIMSLKKTVPQVRDMQRKVNFSRNAATNIPSYKAKIEELRNALSSYKKKFSTKQEISSLLRELSNMAKTSDVKIIAIKPHAAVSTAQQDVSTGAYQKFPISIEAKCGYHQLGTFLNKLENADIFMRATDIKIISHPQDMIEHRVYVVVNTYIIAEGP